MSNFQSHNSASAEVPVTVIGGFLGSGKTTLLNRVLREASGVRYAVMVNDFGELAIDEMLIQEHDGETISFANGCVCCSLGDNLVESIDQLLERTPPPEQFLIEVSGVANPKAIADVATLHPRLRRDLIISLVDATSVQRRISDPRLEETIKMQLAPADLLILNKTDLSQYDQISHIERQLHALSTAPIITAEYALVPASVLSAKSLDTDITCLQQPSPKHAPAQQFWQTSVTPHPALDTPAIKAILLKHQYSLLRGKGFINPADVESAPTWKEIQFSGSRVDIRATHPGGTQPQDSVLTLIGIEPLDRLVEALSTDPDCRID